MSERKPKVLFIACPFPPYREVAAVRTWNIARYLVDLGWEVTVVTPDPSAWRHPGDIQDWDNRIRSAGIRRILTRRTARWLDPEILKCRNEGLSRIVGGLCRRVARSLHIDNWGGWARDAESACSTLRPADVDVVLATGSPFASFGLAKRLSDKLGRPYVLDYRDPWSGNWHPGSSSRAAAVHQEAKLLTDSAAVTVVSPSWASELGERFGVGHKVHVVTNGYDPDELEKIEPQEFGHFAVVYTGSFYPPKRVITPIMSALALLKDTELSQDFCFHYYGDEEAHVREEAERAGMLGKVVIHGRAARSEALAAVRGAGVAVVISTVDDSLSVEDKGIIPAKLFETIGLGRPTLVVAPAGSDVERVGEASGFARTFSGTDVSGIASFILDVMHGRGPSGTNREMYAWTTIAIKLDRILRVAARQSDGIAVRAASEQTVKVLL